MNGNVLLQLRFRDTYLQGKELVGGFDSQIALQLRETEVGNVLQLELDVRHCLIVDV